MPTTSVLIGAEATAYDQPITYNPCLECKLRVAACPVGAIGSDGHFNFSAFYTHNSREFMGGFTALMEQIADSKSALEYRKNVSDPEVPPDGLDPCEVLRQPPGRSEVRQEDRRRVAQDERPVQVRSLAEVDGLEVEAIVE